MSCCIAEAWEGVSAPRGTDLQRWVQPDAKLEGRQGSPFFRPVCLPTGKCEAGFVLVVEAEMNERFLLLFVCHRVLEFSFPSLELLA